MESERRRSCRLQTAQPTAALSYVLVLAAERLQRIRRLRKERGWTQTDLATRVGTTKRAIIHYETHGKFPPAPILAAMAGAFDLSIEALMSPDEPKRRTDKDEPNLLDDPEDRRLWRKLKVLKSLPERDQQAIIRMLDTMAKAHEPTAATG